MNGKNKTIFNLVIVLFTILISAPVCSSTIISSYGILGEVNSVLVCENGVQIEQQEHKVYQHNNIEAIKIIQVFNIWLLVLAIVLFKKYSIFFLRLPVKETLVSMSIRMDN